MKKIHTFFAIAATILMTNACHEVEHVEPTAERQGITSLTAIFTSGPYVDQEAAKITITDNSATKYVIPVPWFFPVTSDNETEAFMTKMRVQAELQPNCFINPPLTLLDLTKENHFTYTDAQGVSQDIIITGERVKSSACELISFSLDDPAISGIIDKSKKTVSLISLADLASCMASFEVSAHATISPDPSTTALNYNEPVELTVTAHDGTTKNTYTVVKAVPEKIDKGFNLGSVENLFNLNTTNLGLPGYDKNACISMAAAGNNLVVSTGSGTPLYFNKATGVKLGEINLGGAVAASVTSDSKEHVLICNHAEPDETINIYRTSSVTEAPTLFHSFTNASGLPAGYRIKVNGDIDSDAMIVITCEGIAGVTTSSKAITLSVTDGAVSDVSTIDLSGAGLNWNEAPNEATVVSASSTTTEGWFEQSYAGGNCTLNYLKKDLSIGAQLSADDGNAWGWQTNNLDAKRFNNVDYLAVFVVSYFPSWGIGPQLYLLDISDKTALTGSFNSCPATVLSNKEIAWFQTGAYAIATGDVLIAPSADGFKIYIYYYDHNSQAIGGYSADCIKN